VKAMSDVDIAGRSIIAISQMVYATALMSAILADGERIQHFRESGGHPPSEVRRERWIPAYARMTNEKQGARGSPRLSGCRAPASLPSPSRKRGSIRLRQFRRKESPHARTTNELRACGHSLTRETLRLSRRTMKELPRGSMLHRL
jgi:hypothetical protein